MFSLSFFPIEILEWITSVVHASEQTRLWQCGDRILNIKLKNGGLKRTSLCWSKSTLMPWPRWYFTTFDSLQHLEWDVDIGISLCPTLELSLLPKTLKHLHLDCEDVFIRLRQQNVHMNDMLPVLDTLRLSGRLLRETNLKNLPSNLVELHVTSNKAKISSSTIFGDLPRSIQRLTLSFWILDESELENDLPSELGSLVIFVLECNFNWFSKLPKSLKVLKMARNNFEPIWSTLPPQLVTFDFYHCPLPALPLLPQSLETFEVSYVPGFTDECVPLLPKNLTRLRLGFALNRAGLQLLPASLTDYDFQVHPSTNVLSLFKREAIRITIADGDLKNKVGTSFPTNIQYLAIPYLNDKMCEMLPPCLLEIRAAYGRITMKGASKLPKSLTTLDFFLEMFQNLATLSCLRYIANLEFAMNRGRSYRMHSNWLSHLLPSPPSYGHGYISDAQSDGINHHLTSLKLATLPNALVAKLFFTSLQKFEALRLLEILDCNACEVFDNNWFEMIPYNVTSLTIHPLRDIPTPYQLSILPRRLIYLDLFIGADPDSMGPRTCDWTDEDLRYLPRSLQTLKMKLYLRDLTERRYEYFPPNLRETDLVTRPPFENALVRLYSRSPIN